MNFKSFMHRRRQAMAWLCVGATLLLGLGAQLHALSHSLQALQAAAHQDALAAHTQTCEQCLQFAAVDGLASAAAAPLLLVAADPARPVVLAPPRAAAAFSAYLARAPPRRG